MAGLRVVTVDFDPQRGLSRWITRRPDGLVRIDNLEQEWADAKEVIGVGGDYDIMIIDTPAFHGYANETEHLANLIHGADLILIPSRPTIDDADSSVPMMGYVANVLEERGTGAAAFVLNAVKPNVGIMDIERLLTKVGEICPIRIGDRTDYARAAKVGLTILDLPRTKTNDRAHEEILGVWDFSCRKMGVSHGA